jgi:hypothetical protein
VEKEISPTEALQDPTPADAPCEVGHKASRSFWDSQPEAAHKKLASSLVDMTTPGEETHPWVLLATDAAGRTMQRCLLEQVAVAASSTGASRKQGMPTGVSLAAQVAPNQCLAVRIHS